MEITEPSKKSFIETEGLPFRYSLSHGGKGDIYKCEAWESLKATNNHKSNLLDLVSCTVAFPPQFPVDKELRI